MSGVGHCVNCAEQPARAGVEWPEYLMIRDTKLYDDMGGGGQRIYTTAGRGYEKVKYVRADLAQPSQPADGEADGWPDTARIWLYENPNDLSSRKTKLVFGMALGVGSDLDVYYHREVSTSQAEDVEPFAWILTDDLAGIEHAKRDGNEFASMLIRLQERTGWGIPLYLRPPRGLEVTEEYEFEVWQNDSMQAGGAGSAEMVLTEAGHYAMMYAQDGDVEIRYYARRRIDEAALSGVQR